MKIITEPAGITWERTGPREHWVMIRRRPETYYVVDLADYAQAAPYYPESAQNMQGQALDEYNQSMAHAMTNIADHIVYR